MIEQQHNDMCYVQFGLYRQFPHLVHGIFTRLGGYSKEPYRGLNVSLSAGKDRFEDVARNRLLALQSLGIQDYPCATVWMIHGADVATLNGEEWDDWRDDWPHRSYAMEELGYPKGTALHWTFKPRHKADALITKRRGVALVMSTADCVSILLYDPMQEAIGIVHAGWRGTARGIAAATIAEMGRQFGSQPGDIYAGVGPSIGPCCYEVSEQVQRLFLGEHEFDTMPTEERYRDLVRESAAFSVVQQADRESLRLDLWETNRKQLRLAGIPSTHIEMPAICTSCETDRFFSHRAEQGQAGRFPAIIALHGNEE